jgi:hypothetical protein
LGYTSLFDAYHVPKPLPQQLLPFGRSGDGLEVLTFGVEQFLVLSVPCGRSARAWRTVCRHSVRCVFFVFFLVFVSIRWDFEFWLGEVSDGPCVPGGQSACSPWTVRYSGCGSVGSESFFGQSTCGVRTVHDPFADGLPVSHGQSAQAFAVQSLCFRSCLLAFASCT